MKAQKGKSTKAAAIRARQNELFDFFCECEAPIPDSLMPTFERTESIMDAFQAKQTHQLSSNGIAEAWEVLGFEAKDYAHLDNQVAQQLLKICVKFTSKAWEKLFKAFQQNNLESQIPQVFEDFYENLEELTSETAIRLATLENMPCPTDNGTQECTLELVCLGHGIGLRKKVAPYDNTCNNYFS